MSTSLRIICLFFCWLFATVLAVAQSTYGTILGTVKDPSGSFVAQAKVKVVNQGTSAERSATTDDNGAYLVPNLEPAIYKVTIDATGFAMRTVEKVELGARQTLRVDAAIDLVSVTESVNVNASAGPMINTETSTIAQTKSGSDLINLPVTLGARAAGSTSPMSTLTAQPGVQTDAQGNMSVAGGQPSQLSVSVDGISSVGVRTSGPLNELFPSMDTIAEIRINQVNNSAEYGSVSDITTISKSGTNRFHGGGFWNFQSSAMDARNPFAATKPFKVMNDVGGSIGGPLIKDKTFFFAAVEGLRLPNQRLVVQSVPSMAFRNGDLSSIATAIYDPSTGLPFPNNQIPVSPVAANLLRLVMPVPNTGAANLQANNYRELFRIPINTNQGDVRVDHTLSDRQNLFVRFTYKDVDSTTSPGQTSPTISALAGTIRVPEQVAALTVAHNMVLKPTLFNEIRAGFTGRNFLRTYEQDAATLISQMGITGLAAPPAGAALPDVQIAGYQRVGGLAESATRDRTFQLLDNVTWTKGSHTLKFGGDIRYMRGTSVNVFGTRRLGVYIFDGSVTGVAASGQNHPLIGNTFAAFLLGVPDSTSNADVKVADLRAYATHWAGYAQDDWKVTSRLTLNYGLRWEYHPMFKDKLLNVTNFMTDYVGFNNGQPVRGAVVVPNEESRALTAPGFATSIGNTPILTAAEAGIPESLRFTQRTSFAPRFGFAWRPSSDEKTVIRGGVGRYIVTLMGGLVGAQWGVHASNVTLFSQQVVNGAPLLQFPSPFLTGSATVGTQNFQQAQQIDYKDPYVYQWNLTIEREIARNTGIRLSYNGSQGNRLSVPVDYNQVPANTIGYNAAKLSRPFTNWAKVQAITNGAEARFHSVTIEGNRRMSAGVQFQASYSLSKNLSNVNGIAPTNFATENGNIISDRFNPGIDIGNVAYTRRHRFLTTFTVQLPFGKGRPMFGNSSKLVDTVIGGWDVAGVTLMQSGPFQTAQINGADPSGTGLPTLCACNVRPDIVSGMTGNLPADQRSIDRWFDPAAFVRPPNNIGRFGNAPVGNLIGPGTVVMSASVSKKFVISESIGMMFAAQATNLLNHQNYDVPNTVVGTANYGRISNLQSAEGAGPRVMQLVLRLTF